jgi:hypothetical protein
MTNIHMLCAYRRDRRLLQLIAPAKHLAHYRGDLR